MSLPLRPARHRACGEEVVYLAHRHSRQCYADAGPATIVVCGETDVPLAWCRRCRAPVEIDELDVSGPYAIVEVNS